VRAQAQVWAILGDRLGDALRVPSRASETDEVLDAVAEHRLDPYAAADRLLDPLLRGS
jgi:hypothetical protein